MNYRILIALFLIIIGLALGNYAQYKKVKTVKTELSVTTNNLKSEKLQTISWKDKYNKNHSKSILQEITLGELKRSSDSSSLAVKDLTKKYNIALRKLIGYGDITTIVEFDTVVALVKDSSIYGQHDLSNEWITQIVGIYPDSITSTVTAESKKDILAYSQKETVYPARKFFLWRLFQQKQRIIYIETIEQNPIFKTKSQKFTRIDKK